MRYGSLSDHFTGIAAKRLSAVEVDPARSHQNELNGARELRRLLGPERIERRPAGFIWLGGENEGVSDEAPISWYDARERPETLRMAALLSAKCGDGGGAGR